MKLRAKFPQVAKGPPSAFLQKRLQQRKFFDSGDYNMAKAKGLKLPVVAQKPVPPTAVPSKQQDVLSVAVGKRPNDGLSPISLRDCFRFRRNWRIHKPNRHGDPDPGEDSSAEDVHRAADSEQTLAATVAASFADQPTNNDVRTRGHRIVELSSRAMENKLNEQEVQITKTSRGGIAAHLGIFL